MSEEICVRRTKSERIIMDRRYQIRTIPHSLVFFFTEAVRETITTSTHTYTAIRVKSSAPTSDWHVRFPKEMVKRINQNIIYRDEQLNKERCVKNRQELGRHTHRFLHSRSTRDGSTKLGSQNQRG